MRSNTSAASVRVARMTIRSPSTEKVTSVPGPILNSSRRTFGMTTWPFGPTRIRISNIAGYIVLLSFKLWSYKKYNFSTESRVRLSRTLGRLSFEPVPHVTTPRRLPQTRMAQVGMASEGSLSDSIEQIDAAGRFHDAVEMRFQVEFVHPFE